MSVHVSVRQFRRPDQPQPVYPQVVDTTVRTWMPAIAAELACVRTQTRAPLDVRLPEWQPEFTWTSRVVDAFVQRWAPIFASELAGERTRVRPPLDVRDWLRDVAWIVFNLPGSTVAQQWPAILQALSSYRSANRALLDVRQPDAPTSGWSTATVDTVVRTWISAFSSALGSERTRPASSLDVRWGALPTDLSWIVTIEAPSLSVAQMWPAIWLTLQSQGRRAGATLSPSGEYVPGWLEPVVEADVSTWSGTFQSERNQERTGDRAKFDARVLDLVPSAWIFPTLPGALTLAQMWPAILSSLGLSYRSDGRLRLDLRGHDWSPAFTWAQPVVDATVSAWSPVFQYARTQERTTDRGRLDVRGPDWLPPPAWIFTNLPPAVTIAQVWPAILQALGLSYRSVGLAGLDVRGHEWAPAFGAAARVVDSLVATWPGIWSAPRSERTRAPAGADGRLLTAPDLAWIFQTLPSGLTTAQIWPAVLLGLQPGSPTLSRVRLDVRPEWSSQFGWFAAAVDAYVAKLAPIWAAQAASLRTGDRARLDVRGHEWSPSFAWSQRVVEAIVAKWIPIFDAEVGLRTPAAPALDVRQGTRDPAIGWWSTVVVFVVTPTPSSRRFVVSADGRSFRVAHEDRVILIPKDSRKFPV